MNRYIGTGTVSITGIGKEGNRGKKELCTKEHEKVSKRVKTN